MSLTESSLTFSNIDGMLKDVLDWRTLGEELGISHQKLQAIQEKYGTDQQKEMIINTWLEDDKEASWSKLATTLEEIGKHVYKVAKEIQCKYAPVYKDDHSEPKHRLTVPLMKKIDPVSLPLRKIDETTAVQLFAKQVVLILHTCNNNEFRAALEKLESPTTEDGNKIQDRPIVYPQTGSVVGWFASYRTAVVMTEQGNECRGILTEALTCIEWFPHVQVIIGAGIAYANDQKCKLGDVLISDQIETFLPYKQTGDQITNRGPRERIGPNVRRVFKNPAKDWSDRKRFTCSKDNRKSVAHVGCIISTPILVSDETLRDKLRESTPNAIGGEMEGWVLLEVRSTLKYLFQKEIEVIIIKGVADYGDNRKGDKWQWTAAKAAMDCIHYCLKRSGGNEFCANEVVRQVAQEVAEELSGAENYQPSQSGQKRKNADGRDTQSPEESQKKKKISETNNIVQTSQQLQGYPESSPSSCVPKDDGVESTSSFQYDSEVDSGTHDDESVKETHDSECENLQPELLEGL